MECNRDEAARAKEIADTKLANQDIPGAKKFALKAQSLYPQLDGLSQLMATIDVFVSAANKVAGEVDWYGVLGVSPVADEETVKKQYKKLALMLHPDKNKSPGADGAFKLICEAWSLLSDKSKRLAYNQRRSPRGFTQSVPIRPNNSPSVPPQANGVYGYACRSSSASKPQVPPTSVPRGPVPVPRQHPSVHRQAPSVPRPAPPVPRPSHQRSDTFWTICHGCKMHYEYMRKYINHTLLCQNCHQAFLASEAPPPFKASNSTNRQHRQQQQNSNNHALAGSSFPAGRNAQNSNNHAPAGSSFPAGRNAQNSNNHAPASSSFPAGRNADSAPKSSGPAPARAHPVKHPTSQQYKHSQTPVDPAISEKAASVVQQAQERMKREHYASHSSAAGLSKKTRFNEDGHQNGANTHNRTTSDIYSNLSSSSVPRKSGFEPGFSSFYNKANNSTRELTPIETRNMLMGKARKEILEKLNERKSHARSKDVNSDKVSGGKERKNEKEKRKAVIGRQNLHGTDDSSDGSSGVLKSDQVEPEPNVTEDPVAQSMDVPDPDFHDFDQDRTESCIGENEVWAGYDDRDGMPRFYAIINKVISRKPFKLKIGWINSKTNAEFSTTLDWVDSGFYKTCGEFRVGRYEINKSINVFSHKVQWSKGPRGIIQIYPKKGDVWALYRNWAPDWRNKETPEEVVHKYDMIVVLEDYLQEQGGVSVAPLVKVAGFKTVFRPHPDPNKVIRIPKEEMFRFSHQVPHYTFTGEESINAPKGCLELDPAATPVELLEVATDKNADFSEAAKDGDKVDDYGVTKIEAEDSELKGSKRFAGFRGGQKDDEIV